MTKIKLTKAYSDDVFNAANALEDLKMKIQVPTTLLNLDDDDLDLINKDQASFP